MRRSVASARRRTSPMESAAKKMYVGMDVHKDTVMMAVLPEDAPAPTVVKRFAERPGEAAPFLQSAGWRG